MDLNIKSIFTQEDFNSIMNNENIIIKDKTINKDKYQYHLKHYYNDDNIWIFNYYLINGSDSGMKAFKGDYDNLSEVSGGVLEILALLDSLL